MGAWGVETLTNDYALDEMSHLKDLSGEKLYEYVNKLIDDEDIFISLLGIELVDISINGVDSKILGYIGEFEEWFKSVTGSDLKHLKNKASKRLKSIIDNDYDWVDADKRKELLLKIQNRLMK